jgi:hypothetical protein
MGWSAVGRLNRVIEPSTLTPSPNLPYCIVTWLHGAYNTSQQLGFWTVHDESVSLISQISHNSGL